MSRDLTLFERQWVERVALRAAPMVAAGEPIWRAVARAIDADSRHVESVAVAVIDDALAAERWGMFPPYPPRRMTVGGVWAKSLARAIWTACREYT